MRNGALLRLGSTSRNGSGLSQAAFVLREYSCPSCATALAVEVRESNEPSVGALGESEPSPISALRHPDLLISAAAEASGMPVLHYDEDYDRIAGITGQEVRCPTPRGSLR